jgi:hypothetical protein
VIEYVEQNGYKTGGYGQLGETAQEKKNIGRRENVSSPLHQISNE